MPAHGPGLAGIAVHSARTRQEDGAMTDGAALWIKDPLGILAAGAERGVVIADGRIAELVPA